MSAMTNDPLSARIVVIALAAVALMAVWRMQPGELKDIANITLGVLGGIASVRASGKHGSGQ